MTAKKATPARPPAERETADLDVRYGKIGISAVAAAMRYGREPRQVDAPSSREWRVASSE
jgi:hypothetical protein